MVKGSGGPSWSFGALLHCRHPQNEESNVKKTGKKKGAKKTVIASRKSCKAAGTGLSHYILMDKKAK